MWRSFRTVGVPLLQIRRWVYRRSREWFSSPSRLSEALTKAHPIWMGSNVLKDIRDCLKIPRIFQKWLPSEQRWVKHIQSQPRLRSRWEWNHMCEQPIMWVIHLKTLALLSSQLIDVINEFSNMVSMLDIDSCALCTGRRDYGRCMHENYWFTAAHFAGFTE